MFLNGFGALARLVLVCCAMAFAPMAAGAQEAGAQGTGAPATDAPADQAWIQLEAHFTQVNALARSESYKANFADVSAYNLGSRAIGVVLGPYPRAEAEAKLSQLRADGLIPSDAFVTDGTAFRDRIYPQGSAAPVAEASEATGSETAPPVAEGEVATAETTPAADASATEAAQAEVVEAEPAPPPVPDETPAEARQSEQLLSAEQRQDLQRALQWNGFYSAKIDGAFGRGTRASMQAWQEAMGFEPTGVLTTLQRDLLVANWQADLAEFGFELVSELESGIEISLPLGLVQFDHYEPPFAHFKAKTEGGLQVILISQPGDQGALYGLYDILQSLTIIPPEGERNRSERSFEINGAGPDGAAYAFAELSQGLIKGYILTWPAAQEGQAARILPQMKASFRAVGNRALDPGMVPMDGSVKQGLLAGLEMRKPVFSRSGFFVSADGAVVTAAANVASCARVTLDGLTEADVVASDARLALLRPKTALAPQVFGRLQTAPDVVGADVAVAGYSYEDQLPAPVMTYGTLAAAEGLDGSAGVKRLSVATLAGDVGGPVLDATGSVLGVLLPRETGGDRVLPQGVEFAATGASVAAFLAANAITVDAPESTGALPPEDLAQTAMGMTVLVGCWD